MDDVKYPGSPLPEYRNNPHKVDLKLCAAALKRLAEEPLGYEALRKHIIKVSGSTGKADRAIKDLKMNNWIVKTGPPRSRTPYQITETGRLFLNSLTE